MKIKFNRSKNLAIYGGKKIRKKKWQNNITTNKDEVAAAIKVIKGGNLSLFEGSHNAEKPFSFDGGPFCQKTRKRLV